MKTRPLTVPLAILPIAFLLLGLQCLVLQIGARGSEALPGNGASAGLPLHSSWNAPTAQQVQQKLAAWMEVQAALPELKTKALALWASPPVAEEMLDRLAASLALVDPQWEALVEYSQAAGSAATPPADAAAFARVDIVVSKRRGPLLMELEVIEPELFLASSPAAPAQAARAVLKYLKEIRR